eukprot:6182189-Pleurochrysis_carterae.AAC.2
MQDTRSYGNTRARAVHCMVKASLLLLSLHVWDGGAALHVLTTMSMPILWPAFLSPTLPQLGAR